MGQRPHNSSLQPPAFNLNKRIIFFAAAALISGLVLVYPTLRLLSWLGASAYPSWLGVVLFGAPFLTRICTERFHTQLSRNLAAVVMTWLGISFCALCLLLPAELLRGISIVSGMTNEPDVFSRQLAIYLIITLVGISGYGIYNAQRLNIKRITVALTSAADLPPTLVRRLQGTRIAQISDVHVGSRHPKILRRIVAELNNLDPDYVVITGDLVDMYGITAEDLAPLASIAAPCLFCIGNHERYVDVEDICARLSSHGVQVLRNTSQLQGQEVGDLQFLGIDDAERRDQVELEICKINPVPEAYKILLYHRPDGAEAAAHWGIHLMLTGHTHRGQIFPFNFLVARVFPRLYQSYDVNKMHLYVSPGTGTWGPILRLGSKCEISVFELG